MKSILFLVFFFILPVFAFAQPAIVFETESYDFGIVTQGEKIDHTFSFSNEGNEILIIEKVASS